MIFPALLLKPYSGDGQPFLMKQTSLMVIVRPPPFTRLGRSVKRVGFWSNDGLNSGASPGSRWYHRRLISRANAPGRAAWSS